MKVSVANKKEGRVGKKMAYTAEQIKAKMLQLGLFRAHSNALRPILTNANKYCRLKFALSMVKSDMHLSDMLTSVHLDEKWLYQTKTTRKYYVVPGTWPFVESVPAQRASVNRPAGTYETKLLTVTKDVYRAFLLEKVLPFFVARWPSANKTVMLQHDNARSHVTPMDPQLKAAFDEYGKDGWVFLFRTAAAKLPGHQHLGQLLCCDPVSTTEKVSQDD
ncbi:hypothetical protein H310_15020 [Aphanomyces invadans]|uniref:Uncharacterized protein n=1 Tax=Aphanomyces invadans TaxID=157072 RepID=A0A024T9W3_9STRA|nr:hypothetical protein H310_15020 [Aphanomyces invadans]ETV90147.1 hypothetical protein H310_15020 [Aphanomyces invadans]|eukprot:XP_008881222.1 hypothetical protein H310_15020 [Aphanomyces invadans]